MHGGAIDLGNPVANHPLNDGLVSWLNPIDSIGRTNNLPLDLCTRKRVLQTAGTWVTSKSVRDFAITLESSTDCDFTSAFTAIAWFWNGGVGSSVYPSLYGRLRYSNEGDNQGWQLMVRPTNDRYGFACGRLANTGGASAVLYAGDPNNKLGLRFLAMTMDGVTRSLYLDGQLLTSVADTTFPLSCTAGTNYYHNTSNTNTFPLYEGKAFKQCLTASQIFAHYEEYLKGNPNLLRRIPTRRWSFGSTSSNKVPVIMNQYRQRRS